MYSHLTLAAALLAGSAAAETIHGVFVFSRHGDRTTKWYGSQQLTKLGAEQCFQSGSAYRSRYLDSSSSHKIAGMSEDEYVRTQVFASAPDQPILLNTATAFLQGLYPPLEGLDADLVSQTLVNGSESASPLDGYQYVVLSGVQDNSPDTIWIKGDDACPAYKDASKSFKQSKEFKQREEETKDFYEGFYDMLQDGVYNIERENLTYANAYNIFDLINVAHIHNESSPAANVSESDLFQLRTLADSAELGQNYNSSQPLRSIGADTLSGAVLSHLNQTVASKGQKKFSLLAGSYDTFLSFFGVAGLLDVSKDFHGLPDYASTMAFELYSDDDSSEFPDDDDLRVRWIFRNGTSGDFKAFPLFGLGEETLSYSKFVDEMDKIAIQDVGTWCDKCGSTDDFCAAYKNDDASSKDAKDGESGSGKGSGMSNAVAGVIGAMVTLGVVAIVGGAAFFFVRKRKGSAPVEEKKRSYSTDGSASDV
ncbi:histidine phosphatase superfamily (branch 2) domain-containing protein [Sarocladium implicatum]|nr:histidine phosphatase superfamily (branch 2) domain-containing protein [Sarocladium implicatum]